MKNKSPACQAEPGSFGGWVRRLVLSETQNHIQDVPEDRVLPIRISYVLIASVVTILIATAEAFSEVVLILVDIDVVTLISVRSVGKRIAVFRIVLPTALAIGLTGAI